MSLYRSALPLISSPSTLFKSAAIATRNTTRTYRPKPISICLHCQLQQLDRRRLSTATEYRPHTLDSAPPPPRNTNIPDTSIAGASPEINNQRPPRLTGEHGPPSPSSSSANPESQSISETELEAQKPKPTSQQQPPQKRPSKLRPRKAAMSLTPTAISQLRTLLSQPTPKLIRVGVKNKGCSGLTYHLEYVDQPGKFDETVEQDGVKVLIDSKALFSIIGSEMDWVEDKLSQRFVFSNPNISELSPVMIETWVERVG
ncbi:Iron-sulfur assembly protein 1 [Lecanora helva]